MFYLIRHELKNNYNVEYLEKDFTGYWVLALSCNRITAKNVLHGHVNNQRMRENGFPAEKDFRWTREENFIPL